jgi:hypothetical protein
MLMFTHKAKKRKLRLSKKQKKEAEHGAETAGSAALLLA